MKKSIINKTVTIIHEKYMIPLWINIRFGIKNEIVNDL